MRRLLMLALSAGIATAGCAPLPKRPPAGWDSNATPIQTVKPGDISATNAREKAKALQGELDRDLESAKPNP